MAEDSSADEQLILEEDDDVDQDNETRAVNTNNTQGDKNQDGDAPRHKRRLLKGKKNRKEQRRLKKSSDNLAGRTGKSTDEESGEEVDRGQPDEEGPDDAGKDNPEDQEYDAEAEKDEEEGDNEIIEEEEEPQPRSYPKKPTPKESVGIPTKKPRRGQVHTQVLVVDFNL